MAVDPVSDSTPPQAEAPARIPMGTLLGDLAKEMDETKKEFDRYKQVTVMQPLRELKAEITQLTAEEQEALKKVAEAKENQNLWSYGHLISSVGYASLSIVFGAYLWATGEDNGKKFIMTGSTLLANTLMDQLGGWTFVSKLVSLGNETAEQILKATLPIAVTLTTMLYNAKQIASLPLSLKDLANNLNRFIAWMNAAVQAFNTYASLKLGNAQRQLTVIEGKVSISTMKIEPLNQRNESVTQSSKQVNDALRGGIRKIIKGTSAVPMGAV